MSFWLRLLERVHGQLGWLAAVALLHPAILLRSPRRRAPLVVVLATATTTGAAALGLWLYPHYRAEVKQPLFLSHPSYGWLFERKEHLAVGALAFAWAGMLAHLAAPSAEGEARASLARAAHRSFVASAVLVTITAILGTMVAARRSF